MFADDEGVHLGRPQSHGSCARPNPCDFTNRLGIFRIERSLTIMTSSKFIQVTFGPAPQMNLPGGDHYGSVSGEAHSLEITRFKMAASSELGLFLVPAGVLAGGLVGGLLGTPKEESEAAGIVLVKVCAESDFHANQWADQDAQAFRREPAVTCRTLGEGIVRETFLARPLRNDGWFPQSHPYGRPIWYDRAFATKHHDG